MLTRRLQILQIFNRYLQIRRRGGKHHPHRRRIQQMHDVDYFFYSTSQLAGEGVLAKLQIPWKSYHNSEVETGLKRLHAAKQYDAWQIHNVFPAMSPVVYELALKWKMPIIHYLHNYRFSCVNGFFLNHGKPCQRCLDGNFGRHSPQPVGGTATPKAVGWG